MNSQVLLVGSAATDTTLSFPVTRSTSARAMVKARNMTQADIDDIEARLRAFRQRCARHRAQVFEIPQVADSVKTEAA